MKEQPETILADGTRVRTNAVLDSDAGMNVHVKNLAARRANAVGVIVGVVGGTGGDVYWVQHEGPAPGMFSSDDGAPCPAAYCWTEFELEPTSAVSDAEKKSLRQAAKVFRFTDLLATNGLRARDLPGNFDAWSEWWIR